MKKVLLVFVLICSALFSQSVRSSNNDGIDNYTSNKFTEAEISFRKGLEKEPDNPILNFNLANSFYKQEKYEEAIKHYQSAIAKTEDKELKSRAFYNIGNSLLKSDKLKESVEAYKNGLKINPKDMDAKYNLSYALKKLQEQNQQDKSGGDNKDNNDKNKDQNKDENKDKQDQKNQDKQNQEKQQQQKQPKMSKEEAEQVLNAIKNNEKDLQKKLRQKIGVRVKTDKDW